MYTAGLHRVRHVVYSLLLLLSHERLKNTV